MKRIFVCSRYAGDVEGNVRVARWLCQEVVRAGAVPFAPHLLYTQFMNDDDPRERAAGISCGLAFMAVCDEVWVYTGAGISPGMKQELAHAGRLGLTVVDWNPFPVMFREQTE